MRPHRDIRGAVVVITGASSGIGRATALAFAGLGARLVLAARDPEALSRTSYPADALPTSRPELIGPPVASIPDRVQRKE